MSRITQLFKNLRQENRAALITYICAGDPDLETTEALVYKLEESGADLIELGIPFSDPIADGPTIQRAAQRALKKGTRLIDVLDLVKKIRTNTEIPIVFMGYYNPIYHYGVKQFAQKAVAVGVDGVIVPDLPPDEADELIEAARPVGLDTIFLLAPTSTESRIKYVTGKCTGFVYYVSLTGVTGAREKVAIGVKSALAKIREHSRSPICVGFGVGTRDQVQQIVDWGADGVIVGSAIVSQIEKNLQNPNLVDTLSEFVANLSHGLVPSKTKLQTVKL